VEEGRKRTLGIIAAILLAPKAANWYWDGRDGSPACESAVVAAIGLAEKIANDRFEIYDA